MKHPEIDPVPSEPVTTGGPDSFDRRTHIERINPGLNPAHAPGLGIVHLRGETRPTARHWSETMLAKEEDLASTHRRINRLRNDPAARAMYLASRVTRREAEEIVVAAPPLRNRKSK